MGHRVTEAKDGEEAWVLGQASEFDVAACRAWMTASLSRSSYFGKSC